MGNLTIGWRQTGLMEKIRGKRSKKRDVEEGPLWLNPYVFTMAFLVLALVSVGVYHFFIVKPVLKDLSASAAKTEGSGFSFFGRPAFSKKEPLELSTDEIEAMGISKENVTKIDGVTTENYREKRRMLALAKYEGSRKENETRLKEFVAFRDRRNNFAAQTLREAFEAKSVSDNLALMKLETFVSTEVQARGVNQNNVDSLIYAYQNLTEIYLEKNMRGKAQEAYLNYLQLLKEKAPGDQEQGFNQAISEMQSLGATSSGN